MAFSIIGFVHKITSIVGFFLFFFKNMVFLLLFFLFLASFLSFPLYLPIPDSDSPEIKSDTIRGQLEYLSTHNSPGLGRNSSFTDRKVFKVNPTTTIPMSLSFEETLDQASAASSDSEPAVDVASTYVKKSR